MEPYPKPPQEEIVEQAPNVKLLNLPAPEQQQQGKNSHRKGRESHRSRASSRRQSYEEILDLNGLLAATLGSQPLGRVLPEERRNQLYQRYGSQYNSSQDSSPSQGSQKQLV